LTSKLTYGEEVALDLIDIIDSHYECSNKYAHIHLDDKLSYRDLVGKSNALAHYLISEFERDKTPIVVYGHKQNEMLVCFLACVKAGHAYIPIDSSLPLERINDIISSSGAKLLLNVGDGDLDNNSIDNKTLTEIRDIIDQNMGRIPDKSYRVGKEDTYYIIYTSGSTGKPKGVQITLSCLESFVNWGLEICKDSLKDGTVFMNQAPFSFDLSVMDLYLSLASGSTLFSIDKTMIANLRFLFESFKNSDISIWVSTPSFAEMCLADSSFNEELLPKLELLLFCGETLSNSCVSKLQSRFSGSRIVNTYGPTEATVAITSVEITKEINEKISPLPVGAPKADCTILIQGENGKILEEGQKGEIVIVGDSVSIGYYNNREMTERVFGQYRLNNGIKRGYRTGDEGYLKDGMLYYSGRIDFQVKLNGYRIELEDIENNFRKLDLVKNVVVVPILKEGKVQYLSAAAVLNSKSEEKEFKVVMNIKNQLKSFLPEYMIPRKIVIKETLPMTTNGKVNRKLLMEEMR
jgi:D-alanine--poly(phosphoribitol) ligase subunit 1